MKYSFCGVFVLDKGILFDLKMHTDIISDSVFRAVNKIAEVGVKCATTNWSVVSICERRNADLFLLKRKTPSLLLLS